MSRKGAHAALPDERRVAVALRGAVFFSLLLAIACVRAPTGLDALPAGDSLPIEDARVRSVLETHRARVIRNRGLRGTARVMLEGPDFKLNRPQRVAVERPARLRFEILAPFDQVAAILATDGVRFDFYDASAGGVQRGEVTPALLWDLARIDLDLEELVGLLLAAPAPESDARVSGAWEEGDGKLQVAFASSATGLRALMQDGGYVLVFDADERLVEFRAIEPGGDLRYRARFEEYGAAEPVRPGDEAFRQQEFPRRLTLESPRVDASVRFIWRRVRLEETLPDRLFNLPERLAPSEGD